MKKTIISFIIIFSIISSLFTVTGVFASDDALVMEDFESGLTWDYTGGASNEDTVVVSEETAASGKKSLHLIDTSTEASVGIASKKIAINGGETYTLVVDILNIEGTTTKAYLRYSSPSNSKALNKAIGSSKKGEWERVTLTEKAADDVTHAQIFVMGAGSSLADAYIDNVKLVKGEVKAEAITPSIPYVGEISKSNVSFPEWTKIESIGKLDTAEVKRSAATNGNLSGENIIITNMVYGVGSMKKFAIMNKGVAENGNDFSKYPQKVDIVTVGNEKAIYIDVPASGNALPIFMPVVAFDDVYKAEYNYKFRFKAKRGDGAVLGADNFNFYVRQLTSGGARNGTAQTQALLIEKSTDWIQYEVVINNAAILEGTGRLVGLFNFGGKDCARDVYIKDIEVYVKDNSNPEVVYDMPEFRPEIGMHPRVYFNKNDIPRIKENALHPENKVAYDLLLKEVATEETGIMKEATGDNLSEKSLGIIQSKAFYYAVWGDEKAGKEAVSAMKNFLNTANYSQSEYNTQGLTVFTVGAVYDWCYPLLNDEDKKFFYSTGLKVAGSMEIGYPPVIGSTIGGHSAEAQLQRDQMAFAISVSDEREDIYQNIAGRFFAEFKEAREFLYQAYSLPFGTTYTTYRFQWDMLATYMMKALGFENYYGMDQQKVLYWLLYARRPDGSLLRDCDNPMNNKSIGVYDTTGTRAYWLAGNYWKDPYVKGEALKRSNGGLAPTSISGNQTLGAVEFLLFNDPAVGYKTVRELPLSMYYPAPKGGMIARTGWGEGMNSPAVVAEMKINEWWFEGHHQLDAGAFQIYYKGALANDTGYYQAGRDGEKTANEGNTVYGTTHFHNYQRRTIAHNCMLVYDPDEPLKNYNGYVNDGGQIYHNNENRQLNIQGFFENEDKYHVGKVLGHEIGEDTIQPDYTYLKGDLEKAYGEKVTGYERSFMFLNFKNNDYPAAMIVFDRVVSKDKSFDKKWILHGLNEPEISGSRTVFKDTREGYNGKLTVDTLLPKADNLSINVVGGEGQEYMVNGVNYWAQTLKGAANEGGGYRIEVSPKNDSNQDYFLNVLQVGDANSTKVAVESEIIEGETHTGAKIYDRVVMFGKARDRVSSTVSFAVSGEGWFKYTVADLKEGSWQVKKDGNVLCEVVATKDGGVGSFEAGTGNFELTYLGSYGTKYFTSTPLYSEGINIKVNSKYIYFDVEPTILNSRTMVPLRAIFEALKATVTWDEATETATGVSQDGTITVKITRNETTAYINGTPITLDVPATIINGRFLVPVRFISESLGASVDWDSFSQTVSIFMSASGASGNAVGIKSSQQSGDNGAGDSIENSIDGDLSTSWAAQGVGDEPAWGVYELSEESEVKEVQIAFNRGGERKYKFSIMVSNDGVNYTEVLKDAESSGETSELETFKITTPTTAKYIKYLGKGSNANAWSNVLEIVFLK